MNLKEQFDRIREERAVMRGRLQQLNEQCDDLEGAVKALNFEIDITSEVVDLLQKYSTLKEDEIRTKIDRVITKGLRAIFPDENFESELEFDIKRGQAVAEPKLVMGELKTNIADADSGGVANVVGFLYQLLILAQKKPRQRQIVIADEPFKNLSREYLEPAGDFVRVLAERLDMQVVLITHKDELKEIADKVYRFTKANDKTKITCEFGGDKLI